MFLWSYSNLVLIMSFISTGLSTRFHAYGSEYALYPRTCFPPVWPVNIFHKMMWDTTTYQDNTLDFPCFARSEANLDFPMEIHESYLVVLWRGWCSQLFIGGSVRQMPNMTSTTTVLCPFRAEMLNVSGQFDPLLDRNRTV